MKLKPLLIAVAATAISTVAQAAFLVGNVDGNDTVIDTVNNAEWMRLDVTTGQTVAQALADHGGFGFTFATQTQLNKMLDQFFGIFSGDPGTRAGGLVFGALTTVAAESQWNSLFGLTLDVNEGHESLGFYDDGNPNTNETWFGFAGPFTDSRGNDRPQTFNAVSNPPVFDIGVFLVRDLGGNNVPEPASLALLSLGLVGIAGLRRRKLT